MYGKVNTYFVSLIALLFVVTGIAPAMAEPKGTLTVTITGFPSSDGFGKIALNNSKEGYIDESDELVVDKKTVKVVKKKVQVVFKDLDYGWYAVSVYHDENSNEKLDKNMMGIPKEAFAFSNNALGTFGKPDYEDVKFQLNSPEKQIAITIVSFE